MTGQRIGIIDIGSNSVRLVVYERTDNGGHRVVDGSKRSARLSGEIDETGALKQEALSGLVDTLRHFTRICSHHGIGHIRAVATAAVRNATNRRDIMDRIKLDTGLTIELLSGEDEASFGFLGMINSLNIAEGFLVDIGGGSTELTLFRERSIVASVSFPFGCVSLNKKYDSKEGLSDDALKGIESVVAEAIKGHAWIRESSGLPLVGVGGTVRALGKIHQASTDYPFQQTHNYAIGKEQVDGQFDAMRKLPLDRRRKLPGLSKDRADVIVPGIAILRAIFRAVRADYYLICGAGLRDGLFHATRFPNRPKLDDPLGFSLKNVCALHTEAPRQHVMQVNRLAMELIESLLPREETSEAWMLLDAASQLYRIGASIDYYDYARHSFYLIIHSHLNGLSHRQIIMTAAIASFKSKGRAKTQIAEFKTLVSESDLELICKLGLLLQLAAALDRTETQSIGHLIIRATDSQLLLRPLQPRGSMAVERREVDEIAADFKKNWGLLPVLDFYHRKN
ncbi:Ppx/GppA phosphatase family protein [Paenibacillus sp. LHD-117]|uniref:Ppx/GppA phosphatase family protein n=1 Tax=Paenibacillus sp. LHD-117 TaxID=3071412 RepID=UPI0027E1BCFB|nr:Ppx/GppA phosphatase family protein [Paenibacillus sp. LHD-117]MDQ6422330.1 Ppx/GppA phosphatase family protein [Paenibacillus sp. LHD-117]